MNTNLIPILDNELARVCGGMFASFVNSGNSDSAAQPAPAAPSNSLVKDIAIGVMAGAGGTAAATGDPRKRLLGAVGGGLMGGLTHCAQEMDAPQSKPINLGVEAVRNPYAPPPSTM